MLARFCAKCESHVRHFNTYSLKMHFHWQIVQWWTRTKSHQQVDTSLSALNADSIINASHVERDCKNCPSLKCRPSRGSIFDESGRNSICKSTRPMDENNKNIKKVCSKSNPQDRKFISDNKVVQCKTIANPTLNEYSRLWIQLNLSDCWVSTKIVICITCIKASILV